QMQAASYATTSAAISASRIAARDANPSEARAEAVAKMHFADFGLDGSPSSIPYSCAGPCAHAGSLVTARVETRVSLPGLPLIFGPDHAPHITLRASHTDVVATGAGSHGRGTRPRARRRIDPAPGHRLRRHRLAAGVPHRGADRSAHGSAAASGTRRLRGPGGLGLLRTRPR